jgi:hypothetical protein
MAAGGGRPLTDNHKRLVTVLEMVRSWPSFRCVTVGPNACSTPAMRWRNPACLRSSDEQGLHVSTSCHLRIRRDKTLALFSFRNEPTSNKKGVFQSLSLP